MEQVHSLNYLGNLISSDKMVYIDSKYVQITGSSNNTFRTQKTPQKTQIKLYI